ncbi:MAG TPA: branched-chain amino acid ABC transporter permease, partial [Microvirga sp.]|nr:branched-chain amino acid ABC transporter permease [Microvirga sp.]
WLVWFLASLAGFFAGALVPEPKRFGLDLVMPIYFAAMLVPLWRGAGPALPWLLAGTVALTVHALVPGYVFIIAGALAGVAAAMVTE